MICMLNKLTVRRGERAELVDAIRPVFADVADEPGTLAFLVFEDLSDPDVVWVQEIFADEEAKRAHAGNPHQPAVLGRVRDLLARPMETHRLSPVVAAVQAIRVSSAGGAS